MGERAGRARVGLRVAVALAPVALADSESSGLEIRSIVACQFWQPSRSGCGWFGGCKALEGFLLLLH